MTTDRRYTTDRPWPYPRGRAALIDQVINAYQYVLCFDDGTREPGYFSGHRELVVGERVRAFASRELHAWEIQLIGGVAQTEEVEGLVVWGQDLALNSTNVTAYDVISWNPTQAENWGGGVPTPHGLDNDNDRAQFPTPPENDAQFPALALWTLEWSPNGRDLLYAGRQRTNPGSNGDLFAYWGIMTVDGDGMYVSGVRHEQIDDGWFDSGRGSWKECPSRACWSPSGQYIARKNWNSDTKDAQTGLDLAVYEWTGSALTEVASQSLSSFGGGHTETISHIAWRRDGAWLACGFTNDGGGESLAICEWDEDTETLGSPILVDVGAPVYAVEWSADGNHIFLGIEDASGPLIAVPFDNGVVGDPIVGSTPLNSGATEQALVRDIAVSPDGLTVATVHFTHGTGPWNGVVLHRWELDSWGSQSQYGDHYTILGSGSGHASAQMGAVAWQGNETLFVAGQWQIVNTNLHPALSAHLVEDGEFTGAHYQHTRPNSAGFHGSAVAPHPTIIYTPRSATSPLNPVSSGSISYTGGSGGTPPTGSIDEQIDIINGSPSYPLPDPIPIPPEGFEWEELFPNPLGFQTENPVCDEVFILDGTSSGDISNLRAAAAEGGVCILVQPDLQVNLGSNELEVNHHTALIGLGHGFDIVGRGIVGENKHHVLLRNFDLDNVGGGSSGDGINFTDSGSTQIRIDMVTLGLVGDEQIDLWEGVGRIAVSRVVFRDTTKQDFGFLIGVPPEDLGNNYPGTLITMYECVGYTEGRWPLFKLKGRLHMVNCVKPRWGYEAIKSEWGIVRAERNWFGPAGGRAVFQVDNGGSIQSIENWFDGVANPGSLGSGTFTPPYTIGTPMSPARKAQVLSLAGKGAIPLFLPEALEGS